MGHCRICNGEKKLIKAHAIPQAFFLPLRDGENPPIPVSEGHYPKRIPIGAYDSEILCEECEGRFSSVDDYGVRVLLTDFSKLFAPIAFAGYGYASTSVDCQKLLLFLVAVLLRASFSRQRFYSKVELGPLEERAIEAIANPGRAVPTCFDAILSRWRTASNAKFTTPVVMDPRPERWSGVRAYRLYLGAMVAYVKTDTRPFPNDLEDLSLQRGGELRFPTRNFETSKDFRAMSNTAKRAHRRKPSLRNRSSK